MLNLCSDKVRFLINGKSIVIPKSKNIRISYPKKDMKYVVGLSNDIVAPVYYRETESVLKELPKPGTCKFLVDNKVLLRLGPEYSGWAFSPCYDDTCIVGTDELIWAVSLLTVPS